MWEYDNAINFFLKLMDRTLIILTVLSLMLYCAFSCSGTAGTVQALITNCQCQSALFLCHFIGTTVITISKPVFSTAILPMFDSDSFVF